MKQINLLFILILFIFAACSSEQTVVKVEEIQHKMSVNDIYEYKYVSAFRQNYGGENKEDADIYYQQYVRGEIENPKKKIWNLKRAITYHPQPIYYISLINELSNQEKMDEATQVYNYINYYDTTLTIEQYQGLFAYLNKINSPYMLQEILYTMFNKAGVDKNALQEELLNNEEHKKTFSPENYKIYVGLLNTMNNDQEMTPDQEYRNFTSYLQQYDSTTFPFIMDENKLSKFVYNDDESEMMSFSPKYTFRKQFPESKSVEYFPGDFNFMFKFSLKDKYAVVYAVDTSARAVSRTMRCIYHRLVVYSKGGQIISDQVIGFQAGTQLQTYTFKDTSTIEVKIYDRIWEKPFEKSDKDNQLLEVVPKNTNTYFIQEDGQIEVEKVL